MGLSEGENEPKSNSLCYPTQMHKTPRCCCSFFLLKQFPSKLWLCHILYFEWNHIPGISFTRKTWHSLQSLAITPRRNIRLVFPTKPLMLSPLTVFHIKCWMRSNCKIPYPARASDQSQWTLVLIHPNSSRRRFLMPPLWWLSPRFDYRSANTFHKGRDRY